MVCIVEILTQLFSKPPYRASHIVMISGLLVLPVLSSLASCVLWGIASTGTHVPVGIYWMVNLVLLSSYAFLLIHLLIQIKKLSVERAIIITLIQGYAFLIFIFLLT